MERTNVRSLAPADVPWPAALVVADLSFIPLELVLSALAAVATADADLVLMVKPQFEVGRGGRGDGVVRDPALRASAVQGVADAAIRLGLAVRSASRASPLPGPSGNVEYFLWLRRAAGRMGHDVPLRRGRPRTGDRPGRDGRTAMSAEAATRRVLLVVNPRSDEARSVRGHVVAGSRRRRRGASSPTRTAIDLRVLWATTGLDPGIVAVASDETRRRRLRRRGRARRRRDGAARRRAGPRERDAAASGSTSATSGFLAEAEPEDLAAVVDRDRSPSAGPRRGAHDARRPAAGRRARSSARRGR